jgi:DNA uptake protein ComE-like DNA-binding protein
MNCRSIYLFLVPGALLYEGCSRPSAHAVQKQELTSQALARSSPAQASRQVVTERSDFSFKQSKPASITQDSRVDLNSATEFELEALPGISPADAETIIENRPYRTPEDLLTGGIISDDTYEKVKNLVVVN